MGSGIDKEDLCIEQIEKCLREALPEKRIHSQRVAAGGDPPDFWLTVGKQKFGVEVTTLVRDVPDGSRELSEIGYSAGLCRLGEEVTARAKMEGILNGTYILSHNQMPPLPARKDRRVCVEHSVQYVRDTMHRPGKQPQKQVWPDYDAAVNIVIYKLSDEDAVVLGGSGHLGPKSNSWIESELTKQLQKSVSTKRSKIERKRIHETCDGVILALYDQFGFASAYNFHRCIDDVRDAKWFYAIHVTEPAYDAEPTGGFLRAKDASWYGETA